MSTVQLVPFGHKVHIFEAHMESANGIPGIASFFQTIYDGMKAWARDNYEGKINATIQLFGTPFSLTSNLLNIIVRVYQTAAVLGLQQTSSQAFFKPMAIAGLGVSVLETCYHLYGLTFQLNFAYNFYRLKATPQEYFSYLFHNFLGVNKREEAEILEKFKEDKTSLGEIRARARYRQQRSKIRMAKMLPLARRIRPWLVTDITKKLSEHPEGVSNEQIDEWMQLIEMQMTKKLIIHVIALITIFTLGAGLILALMGAAPIVSLALLSISPILTAGQYLFECGYLDSYGWEFSWINCVPLWMRWVSNNCFGTDLKFTPGQPKSQRRPAPQAFAMHALV